MSKRGNKEGTVRLRNDGYWEARISIGRNPNGTIKRLSFYAKTRKEVVDKMNKALNDINKGTFVSKNNITFSSWLDDWLEHYAKPHIKIATYTSYETYIRGHLKPYFRETKLSNLKAEDLQKFLNMKQTMGRLDGKEGGVSSKTIKNIYNMIHASLKQAHLNGLISKNIAEFVRTPKVEKREMRVLTLEEQNKLINVCNDNYYGLIPILAIFTGLRLGEVLGLTWTSIDFDNKLLYVRQSLKRQKNLSGKGNKTKMVLDTPKTKNGIREVPLIDDLILRLLKHKKEQNEMKEKSSVAYKNNNFVFANEIGEPFDQVTFKKYYEDILKEAEIDLFLSPTGINEKVTFHTLRHTFATRALELGFDVKVLADILGHADASTTLNKYAHALPNHKKSAMNKLNKLI